MSYEGEWEELERERGSRNSRRSLGKEQGVEAM